MSDLMRVSSNPHIRAKSSTSSIMAAVVIALLPAAGFGIYNFGLDALFLQNIYLRKFLGKRLRLGIIRQLLQDCFWR